MPAITLVVCLYNEGDLLKRLLERAQGCYDDLVVVHDGPDTTNVRAVVEAVGGQFFERPREFQQEPHWGFAWGKAKHDWILRLDADEAPSAALREWLVKFRDATEPPADLSGYHCIWPLWDGKKAVTKHWPDERQFLFHRQRVRFFGMAEQVPVGDGRWEPVNLILEHTPRRPSYGFRYVFRPQAARWRHMIATSLLLDVPSKLPHWRWDNLPWPPDWQRIRTHPLREAFVRLFVRYAWSVRFIWQKEGRLFPAAAAMGCLIHADICYKYWRLRRTGAKYQRSVLQMD